MSAKDNGVRNIKDYRTKELTFYIIANLYFAFFCTDNFNINYLNLVCQIFGSVMLTSCIYVFVFLGDSIIGSELKDVLVNFWGKSPGESIFSCIKKGKNDKRITSEQALSVYSEIYKNFPEDSKQLRNYENAHWYSIYHTHKSVSMIYDSQRDYLLCRDMYIATLLILLIYIFLSVFVKIISFEKIYVIFELFMLVITNVATRQKAKRFVYNVIVYDIQVREKKKENI